jgi:predicted DNA-binding transcriptional regulator YafY
VFDREQGGYKLDATDTRKELPGLWFSQDEVLALLTIQNMLDQLEPGLLGPKLKPLQKRLHDMLAQQGLDAQTLVQRIRLVHAGKRRMALRLFELVARGTLQRRQLRIDHYNRQTGQTLSRVISPQQLVYYRDNWYADAWCHLRQGLRSFSVDAITGCEVLQNPAKEVNPQALQRATQDDYGIFSGSARERAQLLFSAGRARWVQSEQWHPDQKGTLNSDGSYLLEVPYTDARELMGDILRFGADVKVLGPSTLCEMVKTQLAAASAMYRD